MSRKEMVSCKILNFFNMILMSDLKCIEELLTGAAYCQLMEYLFESAESARYYQDITLGPDPPGSRLHEVLN
ncbi:uncharacterized protein Dana_GF27868 [Drosophila ananassae]|uniref:Uncharacterized protein n=1 Tax=Drosophila ananassae TaxID=7217 RepID=A0A0P9BLT5_DROAN|nr:uncharacterized protein Dana_GF27868 [Drosophila ananassae]